MKKLRLSNLLIYFIIVVQILCQQWYTEDNPTFVTSATLSKVLLNQSEIKIIVFITLECQNCQVLKDNMEDIVVGLNVDGRNDVQLYFIDCNYQSKICEQMRISDIPFVIVFNNFGQASAEIVVNHYGVQYVVNFVENSIRQIDQYNQISQKKNAQSLRPSPSLSKQQSQIKIDQPQIQKDQYKQQQQNYPIIVKIQPQAVQSDKQNNQIDSQRQKIVQNVLNQRKKRSSFWNLQISSKMGSIIFLVFGIGAFIYAKKLLASTVRNHKIIAKDSNSYNEVPNFQEGKFTNYSTKKFYDQKASQ